MNAAHDTHDPNMVKTHISLNVTDVERSLQFYEAFFGAPAHKRRPGYANFDLDHPPLKIALNEHAPQAGAGALNHLGLVVSTREQVEAMRRRLIDAGLATFDEGDTTCCYALQNKVWVHDPDGNAWEVYTLLDDMMNQETAPAAEGVSGSACCTADPASGDPAMNMSIPLAVRQAAGGCCGGSGADASGNCCG